MLMLSEACERNKGPILSVLSEEFARSSNVLEVGSGSGQHAVYFAAGLPHLLWRPSEIAGNLDSLAQRIALEGTANLLPPFRLDVSDNPWEVGTVDALFSANTLHIIAWNAVREFFRGVGQVLAARPGVLCLYGPFRFGGRHTSESNVEFDHFLRQRDPLSGIRDFEALDELARAQGLEFCADHAMPANNRTLVWRRFSEVPR
jgi:hypothetical protein